jgi:hypothetical protein
VAIYYKNCTISSAVLTSPFVCLFVCLASWLCVRFTVDEVPPVSRRNNSFLTLHACRCLGCEASLYFAPLVLLYVSRTPLKAVPTAVPFVKALRDDVTTAVPDAETGYSPCAVSSGSY